MGDTSSSLTGTSNNTIHIANATDYKCRVLVSPNKDWVLANLFTDVVSRYIPGFGYITAVSDIWNVWNVMVGDEDKLVYATKLRDLFQSHAKYIAPRGVKAVYETDITNPMRYFSPSGWASLCDGSDITLTVMLEDSDGRVLKMSQFNSNSDWSWIVHNNQINRQQYGSNLWDDDTSVIKNWK